MSLEAFEDLASLRKQLLGWRSAGQRVGLVPTMGNLHAGHLALVERLRSRVDRIVVSIFVNPTQFGPNEDFAAYPRTLEADLQALDVAGADLAWMPPASVMYPLAEPFILRAPESLANTLCGRDRPGHFDGVATVVLRLFLQVAPQVAIFGEKDFQQLVILRRLVEDHGLEIGIESLPTVREADGLAMSSRNQYLDARQRQVAGELYALLEQATARLNSGEDWDEIRNQALECLHSAGFEPQYFEWRSAETLQTPEPDRPQRLLAAARLGRARLIDNIAVTKPSSGCDLSVGCPHLAS